MTQNSKDIVTKNIISTLSSPVVDDQNYSYCKTCPIKMQCSVFKDIYIKIDDNITKKYKVQIREVYEGYANIMTKDTKKEHLIKLQNREIQTEIDKLDNICIFEKRKATDIMTILDKQYDFNENPTILLLAQQLIKLCLNDFRLSMAHKKYGIINENTTHGKHGAVTHLKLTPGLHYSLEISTKIADIVEKIENIMNKDDNEVDMTIKIIKAEDIFGKVVNDKN